jgi:DHA3 family macrolide efflux protein-like MFS transporter
MRVNSINGTIQPFIMIAAPLLSGTLLSFSRLEAIFFIDVITATLAVSLLLVLKVAPHQRAAQEQRTGYLDDLKAGLTYIRGNRPIRTLFIFFAFIGFLIVPVVFLSPLMVARSYGEEVWRLTANEITFFIGSIIGGFIMTAWGGFKNHFRTIGLSCLLWAVLFAGMGITNEFSVYLVLMFLAGIPMPMWNVPVVTLLQEMVSQDMQGRVFGAQQLIFNTIMPAGMLIFGPIADVISIETLLVLASVSMVVPSLWLFFNRPPVQTQAWLRSPEYELDGGD